MRSVALVFSLSIFSSLSVALELNKEQMLEKAKLCTANFCKQSTEGCEFEIHKKETEWAVKATPIERDENGNRIYTLHTDCIFVYSLNGEPIDELQWPWLNTANGCLGRDTPISNCP